MQESFWKWLLEQLKNSDFENAGLSLISQDIISSSNSAKRHLSLSISYDYGPSIHFKSWQLLLCRQVSICSLVQFHKFLLKTLKVESVISICFLSSHKAYVLWTSCWSIHQTVRHANALLCSLANSTGSFPKNHFLGWSHLHFPSHAFPLKAIHASGRKILSY